jgi:hypothetical protein
MATICWFTAVLPLLGDITNEFYLTLYDDLLIKFARILSLSLQRIAAHCSLDMMFALKQHTNDPDTKIEQRSSHFGTNNLGGHVCTALSES